MVQLTEKEKHEMKITNIQIANDLKNYEKVPQDIKVSECFIIKYKICINSFYR